MVQGSERRLYQRLSKELKVDLRKFEYPLASQAWVNAVCGNISAGGMFVESPQKFNAEDQVQLRVYVPNLKKFYPSFFKVFESDVGQSILTVAKVVRVKDLPENNQYGLALQFTNLYEDDWRALHDLIIKEMG